MQHRHQMLILEVYMMKFSHLLRAVPVILLAAGCADGEAPSASNAAPAPEIAADSAITIDGLARQIATLASDEFEGRSPATPGGAKTREYIASEYERLGLEMVGDSYFHTVPMVEATLDPETSYFRITSNGETRDLGYKSDVVHWTKRVEEKVGFNDTDVVFVGYGIVAPEYGWNDYANIDVTGKTVIMLVNDPGFATQDPKVFNGNAMTYYGRWTYKYEEAARQGAAAALVIHDTAPAAYGWNVVEASWTGAQLDLERPDGGAGRIVSEGWIANDAARALFADAGLDFDALQTRASTGDFEAVALDGVTASAELNSAIRRSESANVIGILRGAQSPDEYVLYMAHWDHFGVNQNAEGDDKIYNGAVDNATGVAAMLEIAEMFASNETRPARSILFAAVTAEEYGLLGSAYFAEAPPVPLKQIVAGINIDAILPAPLAKDIIVVGYGASELEDILKTAAESHDRYLRPDAEPEKGYFYRSDHISLAKKGVPMLYADSGIDLRDGGEEAGRQFAKDYTDNRYHTPLDEYDDSWDLHGMLDTVEILYETGAAIAYSDDWPNWYDGNEFRALRDAQRAEN
jgi:Zn-dependent M28 family amino/carboxypeptidase